MKLICTYRRWVFGNNAYSIDLAPGTRASKSGFTSIPLLGVEPTEGYVIKRKAPAGHGTDYLYVGTDSDTDLDEHEDAELSDSRLLLPPDGEFALGEHANQTWMDRFNSDAVIVPSDEGDDDDRCLLLAGMAGRNHAQIEGDHDDSNIEWIAEAQVEKSTKSAAWGFAVLIPAGETLVVAVTPRTAKRTSVYYAYAWDGEVLRQRYGPSYDDVMERLNNVPGVPAGLPALDDDDIELL